jgi:hypothetical protein
VLVGPRRQQDANPAAAVFNLIDVPSQEGGATVARPDAPTGNLEAIADFLLSHMLKEGRDPPVCLTLVTWQVQATVRQPAL